MSHAQRATARGEGLREHTPALLDACHSALVLWDEHGLPRYANRAAASLFGYEPHEFARTRRAQLVHLEDREAAERSVHAIAAGDRTLDQRRLRMHTRAGDHLDIDVRTTPFAVDGALLGLLSEYRDITEQLRLERQHEANEQQYAMLFDYASDNIFTTDLEGHFRTANRTTLDTLGYTLAELRELSPLAVIAEEHRETVRARWHAAGTAATTAPLEVEIVTRSGDRHWVDIRFRLMFEPGSTSPSGVHAIARDVTAQMQAELEMNETTLLLWQQADTAAELALTDQLTGLRNRRAFDLDLADLLSTPRKADQPQCVLVLDLDGFKQVNDEHGHAFGDLALRAVADHILDSLRVTDAAYRLGGDEFAVIAPTHDPARLAERLSQAIEVEHDGVCCLVASSVGWAEVGADGQSGEAAMKTADEAMYRDKAARRGRPAA